MDERRSRGEGSAEAVDALVRTAIGTCAPGAAAYEDAVAELLAAPAGFVHAALQRALGRAIASACGLGYTKGELSKMAWDRLSPGHGIVVTLRKVMSPSDRWPEDMRNAVEVIALLLDVPPVPKVGAVGGSAAASGIDERMLEKVRALLAKAESTEFPDEAEALTAKAQELMSRYAIDAALLEQSASKVTSRRIVVEDPYARPKFLLLSSVAQANRCAAVWLKGFGTATVVGFASHLDACELLYTSLLLQADASLMAAGRDARTGVPSRTRAFRQSFLVAFAVRIGERLADAAAQAEAAAVRDHGDAVLPVLVRRSAEVDEAVEQAFPRLRGLRVSMSDYDGAVAGRIAADHAQLLDAAALPG